MNFIDKYRRQVHRGIPTQVPTCEELDTIHRDTLQQIFEVCGQGSQLADGCRHYRACY